MIQSGLICVKQTANLGQESFQAVKSICCCFGKQIGWDLSVS